MAHLPPVGWADVATKHDVQQESALLRKEMELLGETVRKEMRSGFERQTRMLLFAITGQSTLFAGLVVWLVQRLPASAT